MKWLSKEDIIYIHYKLILLTGGYEGIRNEGMLDSAINAPLQTFDSIDIYPTLIDKVIRLSYSLTCNHPFFDGNKRVGAMVLTIILDENGIKTDFTNENLVDIFVKLAANELTYEAFAALVKSHIIY